MLKLVISANIKMMKKKFKINWSLLTILVLAAVFFVATSSFNYLTQSKDYIKWTSPDESANYFFASRLSRGLDIAHFDEAAIIGDNMVMPRSFRSDFGWLKPVSFLGIILLYGSLGAIFGTAVIPFLTPFFAAFGIIIFYLLITKIFSRKIGTIAAFLLAFFPVYIYYTVRSMFHNVLFIVMVLTAVYFIVLAANRKRGKKLKIIAENKVNESEIKNKKYSFFTFKLKKETWLKLFYSFLAGIFLGLGIITRTSELIWLAPALLFAWLIYFKRYSITKIILIFSGLFLAILPNIYYNQLLYSSPIYGGYNEMNRSIDDISQAGSGIVKSVVEGQDITVYLKSIYHNIFYFGFNKSQSLQMAQHYILEMFPWLSLLFLLGSLLILGSLLRKWHFKYIAYFSLFVLISTILIFYYGSWIFNDNPNPNRFTIGNSYTRYWLPIYLMMMPIVALLIARFSKAIKYLFKGELKILGKRVASAFEISVLLFFSAWSINFVLFGSEEGLVHLYYNNLREKQSAEEIFSLTENEAIIITKYYDKFIFPERRVIMGTLPNDEILRSSQKLANYYPIYYYNFYLNEADVAYLNERKLLAYNLNLEFTKRISHDFALYKFSQVKTPPEIEGALE